MSDILKRLQACAIAGCSPPERALALKAAAEIVRLRLTNEERGAITWASAGMLEDADITANRGMAQRSQHSREAAETLKGLLERHKND